MENRDFPAVSGRNRPVSGCFEKRCLTEGNVGILRIFLAFQQLLWYVKLNALLKGGYTCDGLERLRFLQKRKPLSFSGSKCTLLYLSAERGA